MSMKTSHGQGNLRVRRTHKLPWEALLAEMSERRFDDITVNDVCQRAMVHRTTFYKHYPDKYALLEQGMRRLFDSLMLEEEQPEAGRARAGDGAELPDAGDRPRMARAAEEDLAVDLLDLLELRRDLAGRDLGGDGGALLRQCLIRPDRPGDAGGVGARLRGSDHVLLRLLLEPAALLLDGGRLGREREPARRTGPDLGGRTD